MLLRDTIVGFGVGVEVIGDHSSLPARKSDSDLLETRFLIPESLFEVMICKIRYSVQHQIPIHIFRISGGQVFAYIMTKSHGMNSISNKDTHYAYD